MRQQIDLSQIDDLAWLPSFHKFVVPLLENSKNCQIAQQATTETKQKCLIWNISVPSEYYSYATLGHLSAIAIELRYGVPDGSSDAQQDKTRGIWNPALHSKLQQEIERNLFFCSLQIPDYDANRPVTWQRTLLFEDKKFSIRPFKWISPNGTCELILNINKDRHLLISREEMSFPLDFHSSFVNLSLFVTTAFLKTVAACPEEQKIQLVHGDLTSLLNQKFLLFLKRPKHYLKKHLKSQNYKNYQQKSKSKETSLQVEDEEEEEMETPDSDDDDDTGTTKSFDVWFNDLNLETEKLSREIEKVGKVSKIKEKEIKSPPKSSNPVYSSRSRTQQERDLEIEQLRKERDEALERCNPDQIQQEQREVIQRLQEKIQKLSLENQGYQKELRQKQDQLAESQWKQQQQQPEESDFTKKKERKQEKKEKKETEIDEEWVIENQQDLEISKNWNLQKRKELRNLSQPKFVSSYLAPISLPIS
jgi:hypothetical protein